MKWLAYSLLFVGLVGSALEVVVNGVTDYRKHLLPYDGWGPWALWAILVLGLLLLGIHGIRQLKRGRR